MADAVISVLLEQLAEILVGQLKENVSLVTGVESQVKSLKSDLEAIGTVILDAERTQLSSDGLKLWLANLKDASYDVETLLDEWTTAIARAKLESGEESRDEISETKVCFSLIFSCFRGSRESQEILCRLSIADRMGDLNTTIRGINSRKNEFGLATMSILASSEDRRWRNTTSELGGVVYGQDEEKRSLIQQMSETDEKIRFISIVGMGGIGKTTLAKNVYNDEAIKRLFRRRAWVCVSQPFNLDQIARDIVEQLSGQAPGGLVGRETLMQRFRKEIGRRKFLLILDDVWTSNYIEWEPLEKALIGGGENGNRVIITTRTDDVVRMIRDERVIRVKKLSEDDCWLLLKEVAFGRTSGKVDTDLEVTGKLIAGKCKGLPLAAKTLGGILRLKRTKDEWNLVYESEVWELPNVKENIFRPLMLSYYDLQPVERRCFLYCAVFPKDHRIYRHDIVHQWMAHGYFYSSRRGDIESIGQECFKSLAMRSLFQDFDYDDVSNLTVKSCMMHDIVHDFAQSLTRDEFDVISIEGTPEIMDFKGRHLNLTINSNSFCPDLIPKPTRLHTLVISMPKVSAAIPITSFFMFKSLRSLTLSLCYGFHLPDDIGELIHLRYLCLSAIAQQITLPATINDLFNLQTLRLGSSATLPPQMGKLVNLRHIYSPIDDRKFPWPEEVSKLRALQTMEVLSCGDGVGEFHLRDLEKLNNLRRLWIQEIGQTREDEDGAVRAGLISKTELRELELDFFAPPNPNQLNSIHASVLGALKPCESLRNLRINNYGGPESSLDWITTLKNLVRLELTSFQSCKSLPPLGKLPSLESLTISCLTSLESLGDEFRGLSGCCVEITLFPKLKELKLIELKALLQWNGEANELVKIMPLINSLSITYCLNLKSLPDYLTTKPLKTLVVESCPLLKEACQEKTGSEWRKIRHVPDIQIL